jgi:hypothetical protein
VRRIALTSKRDFFKTRRRQTDLNQAEDIPPLGSSPPPDPQSESQLSGDKKGKIMNPFIELQKTIAVFFIALVCFGLSPASKAVNPPPDGGYPGANTTEGNNALLNLTGGTFNTALGFNALLSDTTGSQNTATGSPSTCG